MKQFKRGRWLATLKPDERSRYLRDAEVDDTLGVIFDTIDVEIALLRAPKSKA